MTMRRKRTIPVVIGIIVSVFCALLLLNVSLTYYYSYRAVRSAGEFDAIIIPGEGAYQGTLPANNDTVGMDVLARMDYAARLFANQTKKPLIIVSGYGRWYKERSPQDQEANLMYQYMLDRFSNQTDIARFLIKEDQSHNTIENAIYSRQKIPADVHKILVLAASKSKERVGMVFKTVLHREEVVVASLREQREDEKQKEIFVTLGSRLILAVPIDTLRLWVNEGAYRLITRELPINETKSSVIQTSPETSW